MTDNNRLNPFGSNHFNTIGTYLKQQFGCRVMKLSLDADFTCPNRDGSKGTGGCIFCSDDGAGHYASDIPGQIRLLSGKWPEGKYLAYFQSHTNTYAPVETLRRLFDQALSWPGVAGLAVATRPDCLPPDVLELLSEYNKKTWLWVELGLQTIHDSTAARLNRCYPLSVFDEAMADLKSRNIRTVVHLILGLPWEDREMMLRSADYVGALHPFGIKLHLLHVMKRTALAELYLSHLPQPLRTMAAPELAERHRGGFDLFQNEIDGLDSQDGRPFWHLFGFDEYIELVVDILERLPQDITIHRVTGDSPAEELLAPLWSTDKRAVLNGIQKEWKRRGSWQGKLSAIKEPPEAK